MHAPSINPMVPRLRKTTVNLPASLSLALEERVQQNREARNRALDSQSKVICAALEAYLLEVQTRDGDAELGVALERLHQDVGALLTEARAHGQLAQVMLEFVLVGQLALLRPLGDASDDDASTLQRLAPHFRKEAPGLVALRRNLFAFARKRDGPQRLTRWAEQHAFSWLIPEEGSDDG